MTDKEKIADAANNVTSMPADESEDFPFDELSMYNIGGWD